MDLEVLPVSSLLRLRSRRDPSLAEESGFRPLLHFLADAVLTHEQGAAQEAAQEVRFVASQLARQVVAEQEVVENPEQAARSCPGWRRRIGPPSG